MFGPLGWPEILFIAVLVLIVFGPRRLPEIGRTMGRFLGEFRRATADFKRTIDTEVTLEEVRQPPAPAASPAPAAPSAPAGPAPAAEPAESKAESGAEPTEPEAESGAEPTKPEAETGASPAEPEPAAAETTRGEPSD